MQKRVVFIVPKHSNEGIYFSDEIMNQVKDEIIERFGGYTVEDVRGAWRGEDGRIYHDDNLRFTVAIESSQLDELKVMLNRFRVLLDQEAIYLEVQDTSVSFIA